MALRSIEGLTQLDSRLDALANTSSLPHTLREMTNVVMLLASEYTPLRRNASLPRSASSLLKTLKGANPARFRADFLRRLRGIPLVLPCCRSSGCRLWLAARPHAASFAAGLCSWARCALGEVDAEAWTAAVAADMVGGASDSASTELEAMRRSAQDRMEILETSLRDSSELEEAPHMAAGFDVAAAAIDVSLALGRLATCAAVVEEQAERRRECEEAREAARAAVEAAAVADCAPDAKEALQARAEASTAIHEHLATEIQAVHACAQHVVEARDALWQQECTKISAIFAASGLGQTLPRADFAGLLASLGIKEAEELLVGLGFQPSCSEVPLEAFLRKLGT